MDRLLVLADQDDQIQLNFNKDLLLENFNCTLCHSLTNFLSLLNLSSFDGVVLDSRFVNVSSSDFLEELRELCGVHISIFILGQNSLDLKMSYLKMNIADYFLPEMSTEEICLRIKNHLYQKKIVQILRFENIEISQNLLQVTFNQELIDLTQIEYKILLCLLQHKGKVSKRKILEFCWPGKIVNEKTLNTHMTNLRNKMKEHSKSLITTKDDEVVITSYNASCKELLQCLP